MFALTTQIATAIMNFFLAIMITGCIFGMGFLAIAHRPSFLINSTNLENSFLKEIRR